MGEIRSNIKKLWRHLPYILNIKNKTRPISLSIHLTNKCNLDCGFCYIKNIDRTQELNYNKIITFINIIKPRSILLTGGEPCLYPSINNLIKFLILHEIKIGMFTNGIYLKNIDNIHWFDWIRVSINHYIDNNIEFKDPEYPKNLGYNYIKHKNSPNPLNLRKKLIIFMDNHRGLYLRIIKDRNEYYTSEFESIPEKRIIVLQEITKHYKGKCYMGFVKPYLNSDGSIYPCWCNVDPNIKKRDKTKIITDINHPYDLLVYHNIVMDCRFCRFWDRNEFINYINKKEVEDEDFI